MCSKDLGFQVDFFYEEEEDLEDRIKEEKGQRPSAVITAADRNLEEEDAFLDGYKMARNLVQHSPEVKKPDKKKELKVGVALYHASDSFLKELMENIEVKFKEAQEEKGVRILVAMEDARGDQQTQDKQIQYLMDQDCDVIVVNAVDPWSASGIIHRVKERQIPVIFINREPADEDIALWDQVYYIGTDGSDLGALQGEMAADAFLDEDLLMDRNMDGTLQYVLVEGEEGHSDSIRRTDSMYKVLKEKFPLDQIEAVSAEWDRQTAKERILAMDEESLSETEAVLCNNDEMALGVAEALQEAGLDSIPVFGIDGTKEAIDGIEKHTIFGTVSQNNEKQAEKIVELVWHLWTGDVPETPHKLYIPGEKVID